MVSRYILSGRGQVLLLETELSQTAVHEAVREAAKAAVARRERGVLPVHFMDLLEALADRGFQLVQATVIDGEEELRRAGRDS